MSHFSCQDSVILAASNVFFAGCEYGDKVSGCRKDQCSYYSASTLSSCCETCVDPSKTIATTTSTKAPAPITTTPSVTNADSTSSKLLTTKKPDPQTSSVKMPTTTVASMKPPTEKNPVTDPISYPPSSKATQEPTSATSRTVTSYITSLAPDMTSVGTEEIKRMNTVYLRFWCGVVNSRPACKHLDSPLDLDFCSLARDITINRYHGNSSNSFYNQYFTTTIVV